MTEPFEKQIASVEIAGYTSEGEGVARIGGRAVFVPGAIRGEVCRVQVTKAGQNVCTAKILEIEKPSSHRQAPECPLAGQCGGCSLMHMDYAEELSMKRQRVEDALRRIGGSDVPVEEVLSAPETGHYRNKAIFAVGTEGNEPVTGFYARRSRNVVAAESCCIQSAAALRAAEAVRKWMRLCRVPGWNAAKGTGLVRHVFCRTGDASGKAQAAVVTFKKKIPEPELLVRLLREKCPELVSIVQNVNPRPGNTVFGGAFYPLWGEMWMEDTLCGLTYRLSAPSFYQVNHAQAERLYETALDLTGLTKEDTALDLCCGTGTITLLLAKRAGLAVGVEIVPEAVEDARANAKRNDIENAEFFCADAADTAAILEQRGISPSVIVADPPRKGLPDAAVKAICDVAPRTLVYVSCDPGTLARDVKKLAEFGYTARKAVPVDLFPRTPHVETVVLLKRG